MNAIELFHQDGKATGVYYCEQCREVSHSKSNAERCCKPCECGKPVRSRGYIRCDECDSKYWKEKIAKDAIIRMEKAEIVEFYIGAVNWDGCPQGVSRCSSYFNGENDGFFIDMEDLLQAAETYRDDKSEDDDDSGLPEFVFCCTERPFKLDLDRALEHALEEMYDVACDAIGGEQELWNAVELFNETNSSVVTYDVDYKHKVRVPRGK